MAILIKKVNIMPKRPITTIIPPIRMPIYNVTKKIDDIKLAILAGARVEEIMPDGSKVSLNLNNYDRDNSGTMKVKVAEIKEEKTMEDTINEVKEEEKIEEPKEEIVPKEEPQKPAENTNMENLTRKQRRALEAEKKKEMTENVIVKNPEDGNA